MTITDTGDNDMILTGKLSARYILEHQEISSLPGTEIRGSARGVELEVTIGQLHELADRAKHTADPDYGRELAESGLADLHRSAKKVVEQLKRHTYGSVTLWDLAHTPEARAAYSIEWDEMIAAR